MKFDWITKLQYFLQTLAFCLAISAMQYAFQPYIPYELPLVYSVCIGTFTWALIDFGRHLFPSARETGWPQGAAGLLLPLVGIVGGYFAGTLAGDSFFGWNSWAQHSRPQLRVSVLITALAGIAGTYYFYSLNRGAWLEARMTEARHQAAEAQLKLLQTQLDPHMLFNTLANLRALIGTDPAAAQLMLDRMNDYLRATLRASRATTHELQAEFARLGDYLALMAVRMGPRLRYTLDLPPDLAAQKVPTLLLQPLVENSIRHGLEPQVDGGEVTVRAVREGLLLVLEVADTGCGFDPDAPRAAQAANAEPGQGFGLAQLRERLATLYGDDFTIKVVAGHARGTSTRITFPCQP